MLDRVQQGEVPRKHHLALRGPDGALRHEEAYTRAGFDGPYTLAYHLRRPHVTWPAEPLHGWPGPQAAPPGPLARHHYRTQDLASGGGPPLDARAPLLWSEDLTIGLCTPSAEDPAYFRNGDADDDTYAHLHVQQHL